VPLTTVCKVCTALDTLPDDDAGRLDRFLADVRVTSQAIAEAITAAGQPTSRNAVSRHRNGKCTMGLDYYRLVAA